MEKSHIRDKHIPTHFLAKRKTAEVELLPFVGKQTTWLIPLISTLFERRENSSVPAVYLVSFSLVCP